MGPAPERTDDEREDWRNVQAILQRLRPVVPSPGSERYWQAARWWCKGIAEISVDALVSAGLVNRANSEAAVAAITDEVFARLSVRDFPPTRDPEGPDLARGC